MWGLHGTGNRKGHECMWGETLSDWLGREVHCGWKVGEEQGYDFDPGQGCSIQSAARHLLTD